MSSAQDIRLHIGITAAVAYSGNVTRRQTL